MNDQKNIRPSPIAGKWYPGEASQLAAEVDHYMDNAQLPNIDDEIIAVMAPHAGYQYSGPVAGYAFAALRGMTPDIAFVLSPMHYPYSEKLLTTSHEAYATPLGNIPVNREALHTLNDYLAEESSITLHEVSRDMEHSLEIELPFLQRALKKPFSLVPIMVREQSEATAHDLGRALSRLVLESAIFIDKSIILVASTDLSHFFPQNISNQLDKEFLRRVEDFDPQGVMRVEEEGKGYACGRGAVASVLWTAKALGADKVTLLRYATSGDVSGEYDRVVGYGAAIVTRKKRL